MRILISGITYAPMLNGQAVFMTNLAEGLVRNGHTVRVIFDSYTGQAFRSNINGVEAVGLPSMDFSRINPIAYISLFPARDVEAEFDDFKPDIVHIQDHYPTSRAALRAARKRGLAVLGSNHFMPENVAGKSQIIAALFPALRWIMWQWMLDTYNKVDAATAQSRAAAELTRAQGLKVPLTTISCGIDPQRFHPIPDIDRSLYRKRYGLDPAKKIILFIGRLDGEKRIDLLLEAMRRLQRDDVQLGISGRGGAGQSLRQQAKLLNLGSRVHFTDYIPAEDLPYLLNSVDIFTMPSQAELLSIATLEALACAKPVLLANAVALPEWVRDGKNGYLFRPGDPEDAARGINYLCDQAENWPEMGKISLEIAQGHGLPEIVKKFERLYLELQYSRSPKRLILKEAGSTPR